MLLFSEASPTINKCRPYGALGYRYVCFVTILSLLWSFLFLETFEVNHPNLLQARTSAMAKNKNIIDFKYICFMNGMVKCRLQMHMNTFFLSNKIFIFFIFFCSNLIGQNIQDSAKLYCNSLFEKKGLNDIESLDSYQILESISNDIAFFSVYNRQISHGPLIGYCAVYKSTGKIFIVNTITDFNRLMDFIDFKRITPLEKLMLYIRLSKEFQFDEILLDKDDSICFSKQIIDGLNLRFLTLPNCLTKESNFKNHILKINIRTHLQVVNLRIKSSEKYIYMKKKKTIEADGCFKNLIWK